MATQLPSEAQGEIERLTALRDAGELSANAFRLARMEVLESAGVTFVEERWEPDARVGRAAVLVGVLMGSIAIVGTAIAVALILIG